MNIKEIEKDITGQWWSGDYLLTVKNGMVYFDTNFRSEHTPFYENRIFEEQMDLSFEGDSTNLKISESITVVEYKPGKDSVLIAFDDNRIVLQILKRYPGCKEIF